MILKPDRLKFFHVDQAETSGFVGFIKRQTLGFVSLFAAIVLSIPGVPGPGFVFFILAFLLIDFPKKKSLILLLKGKKWFRIARIVLRRKMNVLLVLPKVGAL